MKKLIDFQKDFQSTKVVVASVEAFDQLKKENPDSDFAPLEQYPNFREKRKSGKPYVFNIENCNEAIEVVAETDKAYKIQVSHISGHVGGQPHSRHFKWVPKSLCRMVDNILYYPRFI